MHLQELLKQGFPVKLTHSATGRQIELEGEALEVEDPDGELEIRNGKVTLKTTILVQELKAKVEAEVECQAKEVADGQFVLVPSQIIELDSEELDVSSNAIEFLQYLPNKKALVISFNRIGDNGRAYVYFNVPATVYALMAISESKGRFFHSHIDRRYAEQVIPDTFNIENVEEMVSDYEYSQSKEGKEAAIRAEIKNMPAEELLAVVKRDDLSSRTKEAVLSNPQAPTEALDLLAAMIDSKNKMGMREILKHPNCSLALLVYNAQAEDAYWQRATVAEHPKTPVEVLVKLLQDKSTKVRDAVLANPNFPQAQKDAYEASKGTPQGYVVVPQWYSGISHIDFLKDSKSYEGEAKSLTKILGELKIELSETQPKPAKGHVVLRVEGNGVLTQVDANYDTSD